MTLETLAAHPGALWLAAAVLLGIGELAIPGVFLVFLAVAAAITGVATLVLADLPIAAQLLSFAVWSGVTVAIGKRWYRDYPVETADPQLNDRASRLIGQTVTVIEPIRDGDGRVRVGDGAWPAHGPDAERDSRVRIVGVAGSTLLVEPVDGHSTE
ncbi:MAG TPA: NfeD family protein [Sphingomonas sp.]|nr:NfeD family protein [Sphingomonas sp.]